MADALPPLKRAQVFGYTVGDLGINLNFQMIGFYLAYFYTDVMGKHQWLQNGNLLVTESTKGRAFELDQNGNIVWQHVNLVDQEGWVGLVGEAQRLSTDYDRQFFEAQRQERCGREDRVAMRGDRAF